VCALALAAIPTLAGIHCDIISSQGKQFTVRSQFHTDQDLSIFESCIYTDETFICLQRRYTIRHCKYLSEPRHHRRVGWERLSRWLSPYASYRLESLARPYYLGGGIWVPHEMEFVSNEFHKVASIRDPGLDWERTNINVSPTNKDKRREWHVVIVMKK
jgi:hypothetical protein